MSEAYLLWPFVDARKELGLRHAAALFDESPGADRVLDSDQRKSAVRTVEQG